MNTISASARVPAELAGRRLDQAAAKLFDAYSRTRLQRWIRDGRLRVNGRAAGAREEVRAGDELVLEAELEEEGAWLAVPMGLHILHEDEDILVLDKPAGLVVHPAAGHADDTLLNALLAHNPSQVELPRGGIVHRLDRDTSGLLVVAKSLPAQTRLVAAIQARDVAREYLAVAEGQIVSGGRIDKPIGRHPRDRQRMAVLATGGKPAVTHYRVEARFRAHTLLHVALETGRTHQIRVHLASIGHPLAGDPVYGRGVRIPAGAGAVLRQCLGEFRRQALHAWRLRFAHPRTGEALEFESPPPTDLAGLIDALRQDLDDARR